MLGMTFPLHLESAGGIRALSAIPGLLPQRPGPVAHTAPDAPGHRKTAKADKTT